MEHLPFQRTLKGKKLEFLFYRISYSKTKIMRFLKKKTTVVVGTEGATRQIYF